MKRLRRNAYDNVLPASYDNLTANLVNTIFGKKIMDQHAGHIYPYEGAKEQWGLDISKLRDDIWATYLGIPEKERHDIPHKATLYLTRVVNGHPEYGIRWADSSLFNPEQQRGNYKGMSEYSTSGITEDDWNDIIYEAQHPSTYYEIVNRKLGSESEKKLLLPELGIGKSKNSNVLQRFMGPHAIGRGYDPQRGEYVSYGDKWDLAPFSKGAGEDETFGLGTPVHLYDRMYLDDWYDVPEQYRGATYLPEITAYADGKKQ